MFQRYKFILKIKNIPTGLDVFNKGVQALDKALDLYDKRIDKVVPWNVFQETLSSLDKYRSDYSKEAATLIGDLTTQMKNGMDTYFTASQSVNEWCTLASNLLKNYKTFLTGKMTDAKYQSAKKILISLLKIGIDKMEKAQSDLAKSSTSFNVASGKLASLTIRLEADFSEKSSYYKTKISELRKTAYEGGASFFLFGIAISAGVVEAKLVPDIKKKMAELTVYYKNVHQTVGQSSQKIDTAKKQINVEIQAIGEVKSKAEETNIYVESDTDGSLQQIISGTVDELITKCNAYRQRHGNDPLKGRRRLRRSRA